MPDVAQRLTSLGLDQVGSSQKEFGDLVKLELAKWASVVKTAGIRVE
jgi:tripartite-type tricarboxylate transporter receptor subunit TctC